tara:strand:+ start:193 stop:519 length:327 start_codon:yes stop_codon:yes gene_type:complete
MDDIFLVLLLITFVLIIINLIFSRRLLSKIQVEAPKAWTVLGKPESLFSPSKENLDVYKKLFLNGKDMFQDNLPLMSLNKQFCLTAIVSQLSFAATIAVFIFGAGNAP